MFPANIITHGKSELFIYSSFVFYIGYRINGYRLALPLSLYINLGRLCKKKEGVIIQGLT
jgi:hypothetical protein